jgi:predicted molibdopterin-dependent oxidoreductase YjgC
MKFRRTVPLDAEAMREGERGPAGEVVAIVVDGMRREARAGEPLAAALLANGLQHFRLSPVSGAARAPYCMMGTCFECLVTIDGEANRQACLAPVREGMVVETGRGARTVGA